MSKPGRLTAFEQRRRERVFEQLWLAGQSLETAARTARLSHSAVIRYLDRPGALIRLSVHGRVQSEVA